MSRTTQAAWLLILLTLAAPAAAQVKLGSRPATIVKIDHKLDVLAAERLTFLQNLSADPDALTKVYARGLGALRNRSFGRARTSLALHRWMCKAGRGKTVRLRAVSAGEVEVVGERVLAKGMTLAYLVHAREKSR